MRIRQSQLFFTAIFPHKIKTRCRLVLCVWFFFKEPKKPGFPSNMQLAGKRGAGHTSRKPLPVSQVKARQGAVRGKPRLAVPGASSYCPVCCQRLPILTTLEPNINTQAISKIFDNKELHCITEF